jgi:hypothetical protein
MMMKTKVTLVYEGIVYLRWRKFVRAPCTTASVFSRNEDALAQIDSDCTRGNRDDSCHICSNQSVADGEIQGQND